MRLLIDVYKRGVTVIDLLMVIAIIAILSMVIVVPFSNFRAKNILDIGVEEVVSLLNEARSATLSSKGGFQYGVHFESSRLVFFRGTSFVESDINNKESILDPALEISYILLPGTGTDVVFDRLTGKTSQFGTVTLLLKNTPSKNVLITINPIGIAGF